MEDCIDTESMEDKDADLEEKIEELLVKAYEKKDKVDLELRCAERQYDMNNFGGIQHIVVIRKRMLGTPKGQDLCLCLQKTEKGYAYEVLALQIALQTRKFSSSDPYKSQTRIDCISRLMQLYMVGVEVLEGRNDNRYQYFQYKIQELMKRRHVVEEMQYASKKINPKALEELAALEGSQRKNSLEVQVLLSKDQFDTRKISEMVASAENKLKIFETDIQKNLLAQDEALNEKIRLRKMRSDAGSVSNIPLAPDLAAQIQAKLGSVEVEKKGQTNRISQLKMLGDDYFEIDLKSERRRKGSTEKNQTKTKFF